MRETRALILRFRRRTLWCCPQLTASSVVETPTKSAAAPAIIMAVAGLLAQKLHREGPASRERKERKPTENNIDVEPVTPRTKAGPSEP